MDSHRRGEGQEMGGEGHRKRRTAALLQRCWGGRQRHRILRITNLRLRSRDRDQDGLWNGTNFQKQRATLWGHTAMGSWFPAEPPWAHPDKNRDRDGTSGSCSGFKSTRFTSFVPLFIHSFIHSSLYPFN